MIFWCLKKLCKEIFSARVSGSGIQLYLVLHKIRQLQPTKLRYAQHIQDHFVKWLKLRLRYNVALFIQKNSKPFRSFLWVDAALNHKKESHVWIIQTRSFTTGLESDLGFLVCQKTTDNKASHHQARRQHLAGIHKILMKMLISLSLKNGQKAGYNTQQCSTKTPHGDCQRKQFSGNNPEVCLRLLSPWDERENNCSVSIDTLLLV